MKILTTLLIILITPTLIYAQNCSDGSCARTFDMGTYTPTYSYQNNNHNRSVTNLQQGPPIKYATEQYTFEQINKIIVRFNNTDEKINDLSLRVDGLSAKVDLSTDLTTQIDSLTTRIDWLESLQKDYNTKNIKQLID